MSESPEWKLSGGADRPLWEPVRYIDFDGERLRVLTELRLALNLPLLPEGTTETDDEKAERYRAHLAHMSDEDLALHAILEYLFVNATIRVDTAKIEAIRLATMRLPLPVKGGRKLRAAQRDDMLIIVGRVWSMFIAHNFPLNQPSLLQRFKILPGPEA